ncbi:MAG: anion transporter, partial [Desulfobacula sp.]|nr:anion transporter [Desulfobacula sp.]
MFYKTDGFKLCVALLIGVIVFLLPRPEGTQFKISGDTDKILSQQLGEHFTIALDETAK